jgi:hypothetical protein
VRDTRLRHADERLRAFHHGYDTVTDHLARHGRAFADFTVRDLLSGAHRRDADQWTKDYAAGAEQAWKGLR